MLLQGYTPFWYPGWCLSLPTTMTWESLYLFHSLLIYSLYSFRILLLPFSPLPEVVARRPARLSV